MPLGAALAAATTWAFTRFGAHTSFAVVDATLFVRGFGLGCTMMPTMAAAYQRLAREAVPRATTALSIVQRVGGSVGTAILAVVLERRVASNLGGHGGAFGSSASASPAARARIAPELAHAFQQTFWVAFALVAVTVVASLFLPAAPREDADEAAPAGARTARPAAPGRAPAPARGAGARGPSSPARRPRR